MIDPTAFTKRVGTEIHAWRTRAGLTQAELGLARGWNRDAVSKLERGATNISLQDYLEIVWFLRPHVGDDALVEAARRLLGKRPDRK